MTPDKYPDDFELITALQGAKVRAEDFQRHQDAVAGRETGYGNKHHRTDRNADAGLKRRSKTATALDALLASDPEYAARFREFGDFLGKAENATQAALDRAESEFDNLMDRAVRLPDGRAVFRNDNGQVITEDGKVVDPETSDGIAWPDNAPSYEDYQRQRKELEDLRRYQADVLGVARERYDDEDNPMSSEEFEEWEKRIQQEAPTSIELKSDVAPKAATIDQTGDVASPKIG